MGILDKDLIEKILNEEFELLADGIAAILSLIEVSCRNDKGFSMEQMDLEVAKFDELLEESYQSIIKQLLSIEG